MPTIQGHTISHAPSMTLIHSSHGRKTVSVSNSAKITKIPEITAICVAVESRSNRRAHGEMHNQRPNSQLHQSSHCFGSENPTAIVAPVKSAIPKNLWGKINQNADKIYGRIACPLLAQSRHQLLHCTCLLLTQSGHCCSIDTQFP